MAAPSPRETAPLYPFSPSGQRLVDCLIYGVAVYQGTVDFEWDPTKAASNLAKHGVDFSDAIDVFDDPRLLLLVDARSYRERRYKAIGAVNERLLFVAYTMRGENLCRIISARRASRHERTSYSSPGQ